MFTICDFTIHFPSAIHLSVLPTMKVFIGSDDFC